MLKVISRWNEANNLLPRLLLDSVDHQSYLVLCQSTEMHHESFKITF